MLQMGKLRHRSSFKAEWSPRVSAVGSDDWWDSLGSLTPSPSAAPWGETPPTDCEEGGSWQSDAS